MPTQATRPTKTEAGRRAQTCRVDPDRAGSLSMTASGRRRCMADRSARPTGPQALGQRGLPSSAWPRRTVPRGAWQRQASRQVHGQSGGPGAWQVRKFRHAPQVHGQSRRGRAQLPRWPGAARFARAWPVRRPAQVHGQFGGPRPCMASPAVRAGAWPVRRSRRVAGPVVPACSTGAWPVPACRCMASPGVAEQRSRDGQARLASQVHGQFGGPRKCMASSAARARAWPVRRSPRFTSAWPVRRFLAARFASAWPVRRPAPVHGQSGGPMVPVRGQAAGSFAGAGSARWFGKCIRA